MANASPRYCNQCGAELVEDAKFCSECGSQLSLRSKAQGLAQRLKYQTRKTIEDLKTKVDHQVSDYLRQLEGNQPVRIGGITVPENRRGGVASAMRSFQEKYLDGDATQEADYQEWLDGLEERLEDQNCIVCFTKWNPGDIGNIVVCPHCNSGGHRNHISDWVKDKKFCPLCRNSVEFTDFVVLR